MTKGGYAAVLAVHKSSGEATKPLLKKPFLKYGQVLMLSGLLFQTGVLLSYKYRSKLDNFGEAFLGMAGPNGAFLTFFTEAIEDVLSLVDDETTFFTFAVKEQMRRFNYQGEWGNFFQEKGLMKVPLDTCQELLWQFGEMGAILGALQPEIGKQMFELTYAIRDPESWSRAYEAGLNISKEPQTVTWADAQLNEDNIFMAYCQEQWPGHYQALKSS